MMDFFGALKRSSSLEFFHKHDHEDEKMHMDDCDHNVYYLRPLNVLQPIRRSRLESVKSVPLAIQLINQL